MEFDRQTSINIRFGEKTHTHNRHDTWDLTPKHWRVVGVQPGAGQHVESLRAVCQLIDMEMVKQVPRSFDIKREMMIE